MSLPAKLKNEFAELEALGKLIQQRAYKAQVDLDRFLGPAPSGAKSRKKKSKEVARSVVTNFRKSVYKKQSQ